MGRLLAGLSQVGAWVSNVSLHTSVLLPARVDVPLLSNALLT